MQHAVNSTNLQLLTAVLSLSFSLVVAAVLGAVGGSSMAVDGEGTRLVLVRGLCCQLLGPCCPHHDCGVTGLAQN